MKSTLQPTTIHRALMSVIIGLFVGYCVVAEAPSGTGYDLTWHTIDGGGGTSTGGGYELSGTIGQPDAGMMSGGDFSLAGGFWAGGADVEPNTCPSDISGDGVVDVSDLLALLGAWGNCPVPSNCPADINGDGVVDVSDLLIMLSEWGPCP